MAEASNRYRTPNRTAALTVNTPAYHRFRRRLKLRSRRLCSFENIANASDGMNDSFSEFLLQLRAQTMRQNVHHIGLWVEAVVPDMLQNHRLGDRPSGIAHEQFEQGKLPVLQLDLLSSPGHFPSQ